MTLAKEVNVLVLVDFSLAHELFMRIKSNRLFVVSLVFLVIIYNMILDNHYVSTSSAWSADLILNSKTVLANCMRMALFGVKVKS